MFLSSLLESGVDGIGTEATDDLFFGALGDVESGVDGVGTEATDDVAFLVALIRVDFLVGALGDVGFMIVLTAKFLRGGLFFFAFGNGFFLCRAMVPTSSCEFESGRLRIKTPTLPLVLLS